MKNNALQPKNFKMSVMHIDPKKAAECLAKSNGNRKLRPSRVKRYANLIKANKWYFGTTFIAFDRKNRLLNCHHLCTSVIEAQMPVDVSAWWGISEKAFKAIDCGAIRGPSDALFIAGHRGYLKHKAAAIRCLHEYKSSDFTASFPEYEGGHPTFDNSMAVDMLEDEQLVCDLDWTITLLSKEQENLMSPATVMFSAIMFKEKHSAKKTEEFFKQVTGGENLTKEDAAWKLRAKLISIKKKGSIRRSRLLAYIVIAWNKYINNIKDNRTIRWNEHLLGDHPDNSKTREKQPQIL